MKRYEVPPPGKAAWLSIAAIGGALPIGIAVGVVVTARDKPDEVGVAALVGLVAVLLGLAVLGFLVHGLKRREVTFDGRQLVVKAAMYTRRRTLDDLDVAAARVADLREHTEYRPMIKWNGYSLVGFHAGNYWTRGRKRAFALLTSFERVLVLPERSGTLLLISVERPQRLLDDLREAALAAR